MKLRNLVADPETKETMKDWVPVGGMAHIAYHFIKGSSKQKGLNYYAVNALYQSECLFGSVMIIGSML